MSWSSDSAAFEAAAPLLQQHGIDRAVKTREEAIAIEPALAHAGARIVGATYAAGDESGDAHKFTRELARLAQARGVRFLHEHTIEAIGVAGNDVIGVVVRQADLEDQVLTAHAYVVALGSFSPHLTGPIGLPLPVYPAKGHSITVEVTDASRAPNVNLTDEEVRLVIRRGRLRRGHALGGAAPGHPVQRSPHRGDEVQQPLPRHRPRRSAGRWPAAPVPRLRISSPVNNPKWTSALPPRRPGFNHMVNLQDIQDAAKVIEGHVVKTPFLHSRTLSEITGAQVYLKFENHQFTASFKERGALNKLASLTQAQRKAGVIACSAGNHAQGVAYHAHRLGIPAVIVMPRYTPFVKVEHTQKHGAEVILEGENFDAAKSFAIDAGQKRQLTLVHPYDDEKIIAGQGTCGLEMLAEQPDLDALVVAIGGGGLISGISVAAKALKASIDMVGVEMVRFPAMYHAMKGTQPQFAASTIAEGIAVKEPGRLAREIIAKNVAEIFLVDEGDIEESIVMLLEIEKTVVEGAGAAPLAALMRNHDRFVGRKVGLVLGGGNIDPLVLAEIVERGMVRAGRLARIIVEVRDLPGSLARVTACMAELNANIEEVHHQRAFTALAVQNAELEVVVKTRNREHVAQIVEALKKIGFTARAA